MAGPGRDVWVAAAQSPDFVELRRRQLRFLLPATAGFMAWFFCFIALTAWAPELLGAKVLGDLTLVLVLAVGQFVSTFAITLAYVRYAGRRLDPLADRVRERLEGGRP
ncbi:DUF485 domain-containing protein [Pseudonocardia sp. KRD291]|uniref:DUF485 domain-containing protein n=1 Tax=Pseudonocardia sp. KRD291 TaxID=2792007 RepID=UPI001C49FBB5|nr:DUF485 domain-containing protein [Pseudonocardia sp. KRD291]MBW0106159.1 DUF485 domain-containing protein [Pseudonocardia sp. KRD291]